MSLQQQSSNSSRREIRDEEVTNLRSRSSKSLVRKPRVRSTYPISFSPEPFPFSFNKSAKAPPISILINLTAETAKNIDNSSCNPQVTLGNMQSRVDYVMLKDLNSSRDDWVVRVRLCRMWESINLKTNDLISLDVIFIDEEETMMHATIRKIHVSKYRYLLKEGTIFGVKNFKVVINTDQYRPIDSNYRIFFLGNTYLSKRSEDFPGIPMHGFQFVDSDVIKNRNNDHTVLTDIVGCLHGIGNVEFLSGGKKKRNIELLSDKLETMKVTLWGNLAEDTNLTFQEEKSEAIIVIVTSTMVKPYLGQTTFSSTSATKIYVNLKVPQVLNMMERFLDSSMKIEMLQTHQPKQLTVEEEMFLNRKTINDILQSEWTTEPKDRIVTVKAEITGVENFFGWCYMSCNICNKKLKTQLGTYKCIHCGIKCEYPVVRYKIHLIAKDNTGSTTFVLFNDEAEKILNISAMKLLNMKKDDDENEVPLQIQKLCGNTFIFKLKMNDFNLKEGLENYCIMKIFEPNYELEEEHSQKLILKEKQEEDKIAQAIGFGELQNTPNRMLRPIDAIQRDEEDQIDKDKNNAKKKRKKVISDSE